MTALRSALLSCSIALTAACSAQPTPSQINLRSVYHNSYCGTEEPGLRWLSTAEFATLVRGPGAGQHLGMEPTPVPHVDADERLLQVSLGQKGSGGHGVALSGDSTQVMQDVLVLPLSIQQPAPGTMQTMQLTYPCVVVALPNSGYSRVHADNIGEIQTQK